MKTTLSRAVAGLLVFLATTVAAVAGGHRGQDHPTRREMQAYVGQNVLPVVRQQRQKLEAQLASADKAQLATYRAQLQEVRQRGKALRASFRPGPAATPPAAEPANPRTTLTDEQRQQLRQLHTDTRAIMLNVAQLAQKYETNIAQLTQEIQLQREKWATDMQAIAAKNTTPEQSETQRHFQGRMHHGGTGRLLRPAQFLLLNPTTPPPAAPATGGTSLYPNPVTATSQLDYTVTKAGPVTVELLDSRGNILRTIAHEAKQEKGPHTLPVSLGDLATGTYYYKITTRAGSETKRFVKE